MLQRFFTEEGSSRFLWNIGNCTSLCVNTPQKTAVVIFTAVRMSYLVTLFYLKQEDAQHEG
jgi:hypothetical protein